MSVSSIFEMASSSMVCFVFRRRTIALRDMEWLEFGSKLWMRRTDKPEGMLGFCLAQRPLQISFALAIDKDAK